MREPLELAKNGQKVGYKFASVWAYQRAYTGRPRQTLGRISKTRRREVLKHVPTFNNADVELIMTLAICGHIMPDDLGRVGDLRDRLTAVLRYYAEPMPDDVIDDLNDLDEWDDE